VALPAGVRSRHVENINGLRMHLLEAGFHSCSPADSHPCVLLPHGLPGARHSLLWRGFELLICEHGATGTFDLDEAALSCPVAGVARRSQTIEGSFEIRRVLSFDRLVNRMQSTTRSAKDASSSHLRRSTNSSRK
jgi:hypothetical protein